MQSIGVLRKARRPKAAYGHPLPQREKEEARFSTFSHGQGLHRMDLMVRDSNGALPAQSDSVTLIKT
jgi:hypothetical protein